MSECVSPGVGTNLFYCNLTCCDVLKQNDRDLYSNVQFNAFSRFILLTFAKQINAVDFVWFTIDRLAAATGALSKGCYWWRVGEA